MPDPMRKNSASMLVLGLVSAAIIAAWSCQPRRPAEMGTTGAANLLERITSEAIDETEPDISPDGKILLFAAMCDRTSTCKGQQLVGVDPNTRGQRTMYTGGNGRSRGPKWLPDGSSYLYASDSPGAWSLVRALTSTPNAAINVVAPGEIAPNVASPTISPDGKRVAFATTTKSVSSIAVINIDGSHLTLLGEGSHPAWSPDGQRIAFTRNANKFDHIFLVDPDTGTSVVQVTSGDFNHSDPCWSPDGKHIAFVTNRGDSGDAPSADGQIQRSSAARKAMNLFVINRDGTNMTQVTSGTAIASGPNWAKDNWIYFASNKTGDFDIWRVKLTGELGNLVPVASSAAPATSAPPDASAVPAGSSSAAPPTSGCSKDVDCKGDRICQAGACVEPDKKGPKKK